MTTTQSLIRDTLSSTSTANIGEYKAFILAKSGTKQARINLVRKNNTGTLLQYTYISSIEYTGSKLLSMVYHNSLITIKGENLTPLIELLQDEKVRAIHEHKGNASPPKEGETIVTELITTPLA